MHLIIAALGALVTILYLLHRLKDLGVDIGWLNPFHWHHRQKWKNKVNRDPLFSLESPLEVAGALLYTAAKLSGDISSEQKQLLLDIYEREFKLSKQDSTHLLSSNAFLIKDEDRVLNQLDKFLELSLNQFSSTQKQSTLSLANQVIAIEQRVSHKQEAFISKLKTLFSDKKEDSNTWQ